MEKGKHTSRSTSLMGAGKLWRVIHMQNIKLKLYTVYYQRKFTAEVCTFNGLEINGTFARFIWL